MDVTAKVEIEAEVPKVVKIKLFPYSCLSPRIRAAEERLWRESYQRAVHSSPSPGCGWLSLLGVGPEMKPLPPRGCPACSRKGLEGVLLSEIAYTD